MKLRLQTTRAIVAASALGAMATAGALATPQQQVPPQTNRQSPDTFEEPMLFKLPAPTPENIALGADWRSYCPFDRIGVATGHPCVASDPGRVRPGRRARK